MIGLHPYIPTWDGVNWSTDVVTMLFGVSLTCCSVGAWSSIGRETQKAEDSLRSWDQSPCSAGRPGWDVTCDMILNNCFSMATAEECRRDDHWTKTLWNHMNIDNIFNQVWRKQLKGEVSGSKDALAVLYKVLKMLQNMTHVKQRLGFIH